MRRKLFFFFEVLQISRRERLAVGCLLLFLTVTGGLSLAIERQAFYAPEYYEELDRVFGERSRETAAEQEEIRRRYSPKAIESSTKAEVTHEPAGARRDTTDLSVSLESENDLGDTGKQIDINRAESNELQTLPGIGPVYAERIVEWRKISGPFRSVEQLLEIRGIGEKRLENLKDLVKIGKRPEGQEAHP